MKKMILFCSVVAVGLMMVSFGPVHAKGDKKPSTVKDVKSLSEGEQVKLALSAAPAHLVKEVDVMVYGADGKLTESRPSTMGSLAFPR
jgi:hypothetical protein